MLAALTTTLALARPSADSVPRGGLLRRHLVATSALLAPALVLPAPGRSEWTAAADEGAQSTVPEAASLPVYFGCGCFWHVQHELVELERAALGRKDDELTSLCGYAGGLSVGGGNKVCYHNLRNEADYGRLGHAEAVSVRLPPSALPRFAERYFALFVPFRLPGRIVYERNDPQDAGPEYRYVIGLPGGVRSKHFSAIEEAAQGKWKLVEGKGNEPDTLFKRTVYVMDSDEFPFYPAEVYHQFHNDFQGPPYGIEYNNLRNTLVGAGKIKPTGCPEGLF